jgi:hypothetical protein
MSLRKELEEQARLNGMGAERELALMAEVERLLREIGRWKQEHQFQAELTKSLMPYQDRAVKAEQELSAVRELMNTYNLGGWTDAVGPMQRALAAEAELAQRGHCPDDAKCRDETVRTLRAEVERLKEQLKIEQGWVKQYREAYGQSAEKIERLTGLLEEALHEMKQYSVNMKAVRRIEAKWKG